MSASPTFKEPPRGRGAQTNRAGRYEPQTAEALDDGWGELDEPAPSLRTQLTPERARTIISRNDSPDVGFDRSINTYRGCEHGWVKYPFRIANLLFLLDSFSAALCVSLTQARILSITPLERC